MKSTASTWVVIILFVLVFIVAGPRFEKGANIEELRQETIGSFLTVKSYETWKYTNNNSGSPRKSRNFVFNAKFDIPVEYYEGKVEFVLADYSNEKGEQLELRNDFKLAFENRIEFDSNQAEAKLNQTNHNETPVTLHFDLERSIPIGVFEIDVISRICRDENSCIAVGGKFLFENFQTVKIYSAVRSTFDMWMSV